MLISLKNPENKALEILGIKLLELVKDRGKIACYSLPASSRITNPEHASQFTLVMDSNLIRVNDLLINKTIPVTLYNDLLIFRDTDEKFKQHGDLLKKITKKKL